MKNVQVREKIFVKVEYFPMHEMPPLLLSFPAGISYHDSHDHMYECNLLIAEDSNGITRVYSMGMDMYSQKDLKKLFRDSLVKAHIPKKSSAQKSRA